LGFARRTLRSKEPVSERHALYSLNVFFDILRQTDIKTLPLPLPVEGGEQNAGRAEIKF